MPCSREVAPLTSTSPRSPSCKTSSSKTGSISNSSKRSSLLDRTTQVPDDATGIPFRHTKTGSDAASRSTRSSDGSAPAVSALQGVLGQWVPRPPDTQRSLGLSHSRRFQPSPPLQPPQVPQPVHSLQSRSGILRDQLSLSSRLRSPREQLTMQGMTRKGTSTSSTARAEFAHGQGGNTGISMRLGGRGGCRQEETTLSTGRHLAAELMTDMAEFPATARGPESQSDGDTTCVGQDTASRRFGRDGHPSDSRLEQSRPPVMVDVQLDWPPRAFLGAHRERMGGTSVSSNAEGATLPLPEEDVAVADTSQHSDLEEVLQDIRNCHAKVDEPSTQELLAGAVRITPLSQQSSHRQFSLSKHDGKNFGSATPNSVIREAAAVGIQAAVRGAQRRAEIARIAARDIQNLRSTLDSYERVVLPQILVGNAIDQGLLRSEIADLSAQRACLVEKLAERDLEVLEARKDTAAAEADCAALRASMFNVQADSRRAAVDRRLGGA